MAPAARIQQRRAGRGKPVRAGVAVDLRMLLAVAERLPEQERTMVIVCSSGGRQGARMWRNSLAEPAVPERALGQGGTAAIC